MRNASTILSLWLALSLALAAQELEGVTVVLDPGHGDRETSRVPADPGAHATSPHGEAWECVFTWDTSLRLKKLLESKGAKVVLTLQDLDGDYEPKPWSPDDFPKIDDYRFKGLVDIPQPQSTHEALISRVATANRVYREASESVYFLSIHFDSTSPGLAGLSFYYPSWCEARSNFIEILENEVRLSGRARKDLDSGAELGLSNPGSYAVLNHSQNPDSYLIELGNIQSRTLDGKNPDLWRMRDHRVRQEYAELLVRAILSHQAIGPNLSWSRPSQSHGWSRRRKLVIVILAGFGVLAALVMTFGARRLRQKSTFSDEPSIESVDNR